MPSVRLNADGLIIVKNGGAGLLYADTVANYATDSGFVAPSIPSGFITCFYDADSLRFVASTGESEETQSLGVNIAEFDSIIDALPGLVAAKNARVAAELAAQQ